MLSVTITTYNRAKLLNKAIQSVLNQSYQDFELIIIDDCSTDETENIVKAINNEKIRYFKTEKNFGNDSQPKNIGIREAKGEYITFLDDDDIYRPEALKILSKYASATGADVVYGDYVIEDKGKLKAGWSVDFNPSALQQMNYIAMSVVACKKSALLEVGGFDESVPKFKDWNLWLRMQKRGFSFMHIPIIITEVYPQKESISDKYKVEYDEQGRYKPTFFDPVDCDIYASKTILGEKKQQKVAIFTLTLDRLDYTKKMYEALNTAGYPFDWFVIDQGSKDGTVEWLKDKVKDAIYHEKNVGIATGWEQAIELIKKNGEYDIAIKIDNDCEMMTDGWLKIMIEIFDKSRKIILSPYVEGLEDSPGGVLRQRQSGEQPYVLINDKVLGIVPNLGGICFASPIELYDGFKFPDNGFFKGNKDYLLSQYAKSQGYTLFYLEETRCAHIDGTKGQHTKYPDYFKELYNLETQKHE